MRSRHKCIPENETPKLAGGDRRAKCLLRVQKRCPQNFGQSFQRTLWVRDKIAASKRKGVADSHNHVRIGQQRTLE